MKRKLLTLPLLALVLGWLLWLRPHFLGGPAAYVIVSGRSMEPLLHTGDLVITQHQTSYDVGDVVAYRVNQQLVIHRIVGGSAIEGFQTRGDNKQSTDPWTPTARDVVGRLWIHLPGAGKILGKLRQPMVFAALATGTAIVTFPPQSRKRRRNRTRVGSHLGRAISPLGESSSLSALLGVASILTLTLAASAIFSFSQPLQVAEVVNIPLYTHRGSFTYTVHTLPSTLDPDGVLGPISASPMEDAPEAPEARPLIIFARLARNLELELDYSLDGPQPAAIQGEFAAALQITAANAWSTSFELAPPAPFAGNTLSRAVNVDFGEVFALINRVEQETGFEAGTYTVSVVPTVQVHGQLGSQSVDDSFAPAFSMTFTRTQIDLDTDLARAETRARSDTVVRENTVSVLGRPVAVSLARWTSLPGALMALGTTIMLLLVGFFGYGQAEAAQIEARYGSQILSVKTADMPEETRSVDVATFRDLARLAQQNGRNILHMRQGNASHLYFVQEGDTTYRYTILGGKSKD